MRRPGPLDHREIIRASHNGRGETKTPRVLKTHRAWEGKIPPTHHHKTAAPHQIHVRAERRARHDLVAPGQIVGLALVGIAMMRLKTRVDLPPMGPRDHKGILQTNLRDHKAVIRSGAPGSMDRRGVIHPRALDHNPRTALGLDPPTTVGTMGGASRVCVGTARSTG